MKKEVTKNRNKIDKFLTNVKILDIKQLEHFNYYKFFIIVKIGLSSKI